MKSKVIFYEDELNDEFSGIQRKPLVIDGRYKYNRSFLWRFFSFIIYTFPMKLLAYLYMKLRFHFKIYNRKVIRKVKGGFFLYANHTHVPADGFMPSLICFPKRVYVLVKSENLSLWGTRNFMAMIGAIPIPTQFSGMRNFKNKIHDIIQNNHCVIIYPEAHIWPYYTKIRPFSKVSFTYPVVEKKPIFTFTVTYHKGWIRTHIQAYVDGPFFPKFVDSVPQAAEELKNAAYEAMCKRAKQNSYEKIKYQRKEQ